MAWEFESPPGHQYEYKSCKPRFAALFLFHVRHVGPCFFVRCWKELFLRSWCTFFNAAKTAFSAGGRGLLRLSRIGSPADVYLFHGLSGGRGAAGPCRSVFCADSGKARLWRCLKFSGFFVLWSSFCPFCVRRASVSFICEKLYLSVFPNFTLWILWDILSLSLNLFERPMNRFQSLKTAPYPRKLPCGTQKGDITT